MHEYVIYTQSRTVRKYRVKADTLTAGQDFLEDFLDKGIRAEGRIEMLDVDEPDGEEVVR